MEPKHEDTDDCEMESGEASKFNAEEHLTFFDDVLQFYGQKCESWYVSLVAGNTSTNSRAENQSSIPMMGCNSHKWNF